MHFFFDWAVSAIVVLFNLVPKRVVDIYWLVVGTILRTRMNSMLSSIRETGKVKGIWIYREF